MSALLTHAAVGLLLGLALRLRLRYLPVAAFLAIAPDLDHLGDFVPGFGFLASRVTFTNVFVCVALPLLVFAAMRRAGAPADRLRVAGAAPLLLSGHLLLDMLPLEPLGARQKAALFWPLTDHWFTLQDIRVLRIHPSEYSTLTVILLLLVAGTVLTLVALERALRPPSVPSRVPRAAAPVAFASAWILLFPALAAGGLLVSSPPHPDAALGLEGAVVRVPQGDVRALVIHAAGDVVPAGAVNVEVYAKGSRVAVVENPEPMRPGSVWAVAVPLPGDPRAPGAVVLKLVATSELDRFPYASTHPRVEVGHVDADVAVASLAPDGGVRWTLALRHEAGEAAPKGALVVRVTQADGRVLANATNPAALGAGETWRVPLPAGVAPLPGLVAELRAVDDGHLYWRRPLSPT